MRVPAQDQVRPASPVLGFGRLDADDVRRIVRQDDDEVIRMDLTRQAVDMEPDERFLMKWKSQPYPNEAPFRPTTAP